MDSGLSDGSMATYVKAPFAPLICELSCLDQSNVTADQRDTSAAFLLTPGLGEPGVGGQFLLNKEAPKSRRIGGASSNGGAVGGSSSSSLSLSSGSCGGIFASHNHANSHIHPSSSNEPILMPTYRSRNLPDFDSSTHLTRLKNVDVPPTGKFYSISVLIYNCQLLRTVLY